MHFGGPSSDVKESAQGTSGGVFWMNSVYLNKKTIQKVMSQQSNSNDMKLKTDRFYYLGFSLGKIIDLGNAINTVYTLLQLFEEYDVYTQTKGPVSLETNGILRHILPVSVEPFAKLQLQQDHQQLQLEEYMSTLALSETSSTFSVSDNIETVRKPPSQLHDVGSPRNVKPEEHKGASDIPKFKSSLPVHVQFQNNYDDYIMKSSQQALSQQMMHSQSVGNTGSNPSDLQNGIGRIHSQKVDPRAPSFKVLSCHAIPLNLNYCEVTSTLIDMLILTYNKMYDSQYLNPQMLSHIEKIDTIIVNKVIKALCEDINRVARYMAVKQLAKINKALKMDSFAPTREPHLLERVPSDDNIFEIAALDWEANNKQDRQLLAAATGNQQFLSSLGTSGLRISSDKNDTTGASKGRSGDTVQH